MRAPLAVLLALLAVPAQALASERVLVLGDGGARWERDPYLTAESGPPPPAGPGAPARAQAARRRTVAGELKRMLRAGAISREDYSQRRDAYTRSRSLARRLPGRRGVEMRAVVANLDSIAALGLLTVSRLEPLWLTLRRNREWWSKGPLPRSGQRVRFEGSYLVWQYYPGQGMQIQVLANFGKANAVWRAGEDERLRQLLDEILPLAVQRAGGLAWEYYFRFGGGRPPWVSALAQGTAVQALARAAERLAQPAYAQAIDPALAIFAARPPSGVRVKTAGGRAHYLIYSFSPGLRVLNAFAQSLNGLYDAAVIGGSSRAMALFSAGEAQAREETRRYDTGAWSLYSLRGREADVGYHRLARDFLRGLCERTSANPYCSTAERFTAYLSQPPRVRLQTRRLRARAAGSLRFSLSKRSRVGVTVRRNGRTVLATSAYFGYGHRAFFWRPRSAGTYEVRLRATADNGRASTAAGRVRVLRPRGR